MRTIADLNKYEKYLLVEYLISKRYVGTRKDIKIYDEKEAEKELLDSDPPSPPTHYTYVFIGRFMSLDDMFIKIGDNMFIRKLK